MKSGKTTAISKAAQSSTERPQSSTERLLSKRNRDIRKRRKQVASVSAIAVFIVIAIVLAFTTVNQQTAAKVSAVKTAEVESGFFYVPVSVEGSFEPIDLSDVRPDVAGVFSDIKVSVGQAVAKGDALFTIANSELDSKIDAARQTLDDAYSSHSGISRTIEGLRASYQEAYTVHQKQTMEYEAALKEQGSSPEPGTLPAVPQPFDGSAALSAISTHEAALISADQAVKSAQAAYDSLSAEKERYTFFAPISGTVTDLNFSEGSSTSSLASYALRIADLSSMYLAVDIPESEVSKVEEGQDVDISVDFQETIRIVGLVDGISIMPTQPDASSPGSASGTVSYRATIAFDVGDSPIRPGMTAQAEIKTRPIENTLIVPKSAVAEAGGRSYVYPKMEDGAFEQVEVGILATNATQAAIETDTGIGAGAAVAQNASDVDTDRSR